MGSKGNDLSAKVCLFCNKTVNDAIFCKSCASPYHRSCANRVGVLESGAFSKCCRPRSPIMSQTDSGSLASSAVNDTGLTINSLESIINKAIGGLQCEIKGNFTTLTSSVDNLSKKFDEISCKVDETISTISDHSKRLSVLEGVVDNLNTNSIARDCMSEIRDRLSRSRNLILFGFTENGENDKNVLSRNLSTSVSKLFLNYSSPSLLDNSKLFRIGISAQTQGQSRPVKIVCESEEKARALHVSFLSAKRDEKYRHLITNMRLSWDKTRMEMEELAQLRKELTMRQEKGEIHARIVFRHGVPMIVSSSQHPKPSTSAQVL